MVTALAVPAFPSCTRAEVQKRYTETSKQQHPNIPTLLHFRLESTCCSELEFSDFVSGTL